MIPARIVGAAIEDEALARTGRILGDFASDLVANAALDAVRDAINSDDPAVVQAMAERIGLAAERKADTPTVDAGHGTDCTSEVCVWWPEPHGHVRVTRDRFVTPWREVPDADE